MKPQTPEEELINLRKELDKAQQELTETKRALATSELRNEALNTLIDVAERQGIKIRKNLHNSTRSDRPSPARKEKKQYLCTRNSTAVKFTAIKE